MHAGTTQATHAPQHEEPLELTFDEELLLDAIAFTADGGPYFTGDESAASFIIAALQDPKLLDLCRKHLAASK